MRHTLGSTWLMNAFSERDGTMASRLALCLVLPCVLGVVSGTTAVSAQDPVPVVIDSDMISDDWMATLFVLNDPAFSVKAITVTGTGFAYCDAAEDAFALFTSTIQDSPEPVTVLALGPLTNVGAALEATPALAENIAMIYVMGGAVDVEGSSVSEENAVADSIRALNL